MIDSRSIDKAVRVPAPTSIKIWEGQEGNQKGEYNSFQDFGSKCRAIYEFGNIGTNPLNTP